MITTDYLIKKQFKEILNERFHPVNGGNPTNTKRGKEK